MNLFRLLFCFAALSVSVGASRLEAPPRDDEIWLYVTLADLRNREQVELGRSFFWSGTYVEFYYLGRASVYREMIDVVESYFPETSFDAGRSTDPQFSVTKGKSDGR